MTQSMTGFATTTLSLVTNSASVSATLTIKTLNSRFFDISCKLPYALSHLESEIIRYCKESLHRGSVSVVLYVSNPSALKSNVSPSLALAEGYLTSIKTLQNKLEIPGTLTISDFITLPHLFETSEEAHLTDNNAIIIDILKDLLTKVINVREQEGIALQKDLMERMAILRSNIEALEPRAYTVAEDRKIQFMEELKKALITLQAGIPDGSFQALSNAFEKKDVHEEIVRFKNHIETFEATLHDRNIQKGKKLDFILQEMLREINTLGAKLIDAQASNYIIAIKVELEKAREQVQNIV